MATSNNFLVNFNTQLRRINMKKKFKVKVLVTNPVELTYLVEAENEQEARENYEGFEIIEEEQAMDNDYEVVDVEEVKEITDEQI